VKSLTNKAAVPTANVAMTARENHFPVLGVKKSLGSGQHRSESQFGENQPMGAFHFIEIDDEPGPGQWRRGDARSRSGPSLEFPFFIRFLGMSLIIML
jgi:hypothetical protein